MDGTLLIGLGLFALMVGSVVMVTLAERRAQYLLARDERARRASDDLHHLDGIIEGIGRLPIPQEVRTLLRNERLRLARELSAEAIPEVPPALETATPSGIAASYQALSTSLGELQSARRYLRDLERQGSLANSERVQFVQALTKLSVTLQADSFAAWAEMPGTEPNAADAYLRDAQEVLQKSLHLDGHFATRIAELKALQQSLTAERVRRARAEAEANQARETAAQAKLRPATAPRPDAARAADRP